MRLWTTTLGSTLCALLAAKAKEHLARLDKLCFFPCSEYRDLKDAIETYERSGGKVKPAAVR